jgi:hypothetical protein
MVPHDKVYHDHHLYPTAASIGKLTSFGFHLVKSGKIEILSGGWVSVDEATTHYTAVLDQLIEGHLWLKEHLGVYPNISWSIDPFGYSASLPYLWKKAANSSKFLAFRFSPK